MSITVFSSNFLVHSISFYWTVCEFDFMSHSLIWHCICLMNKQWFVRHSLRFIIDYQKWWMTVCAHSSRRWSRDSGTGSARLESCCTCWFDTVRRVKCTVSPKQEWKHCRLAENYTASPCSSGSWSMLRAFYLCLLFCLLSSRFVFCFKQGFANSTAARGRHTKISLLSRMNVGNPDLSSHAVISLCCTFVSTFYFVVGVLFFCFLPIGLHTQIICWAMSRLSPSHWKASHLAVIVFELQKETPIPPFPDRDAMRGKENVFFVREFPWLLGGWCHYTHSSPPSQCFHKLTDQICWHMAEQTTAIHHQRSKTLQRTLPSQQVFLTCVPFCIKPFRNVHV